MVIEHNRSSIWTRPLSIQTEFMRKSGSGSRCIGIGWEDMILPGVEDPPNCMDPLNLGQSEWDQKLGKIECVFSLYDKMRWKWDDVYVLPGSAEYILPVTLSTSVTPVSPYTRRRSLKMYLEAVIERVWRPWSSVSGGRDRACLEMHLETEIEWTQMHLEAGIERVWRCTWRPRSSELRDAHRSRNWACWEIHLEAMIEQDWRSTWRRLIWKRLIWRRSIWRQSIWRQWIWRQWIWRQWIWKR